MEETNKKINKKKTKKINKKRILTIIVCLAVIVAIVMVVKNNKKESTVGKTHYEILEDGIKLNVSEKLMDNKEFENFKLTNIQITRVNEVTTILADVVNNGKEKNRGFAVSVKFVDDQGKEINTVIGYIPEIEPGETRELVMLSTDDVSEAYDFEITRK